MEFVKSALYIIAVLSVLVVVHEWGHFIVAKLCNMRVEDFSLFFGKRLIRLGVRNGTEYNIRMVPLGGFVRIAGMEPDDISNGAPIFRRIENRPKRGSKVLRGLDEDTLSTINFDQVSDRVSEVVAHSINDEGMLTLSGKAELGAFLVSPTITEDEHRYLEAILNSENYKPDPGAYNQKPLWQRAAVIFAGPFMSLFFGYALFCCMGFTTGLPNEQLDTLIENVAKGKPAEKAGLLPGDRIVQINATPIRTGEAMVNLIRKSAGKPLEIRVNRDNTEKTFVVTPELGPIQDFDIKTNKFVTKDVGLIGIGPHILQLWVRHTPKESVINGTIFMGRYVQATLSSLFSKQVSKNIGGIITISKKIHEDSKEGPRQVLLTSALLSISLGIINLFPIPILDGGHLLLLAWEGIRRRKLSSREVYAAQMVGLSIIGVLFVLVMYNDIMRLLPGAAKP